MGQHPYLQPHRVPLQVEVELVTDEQALMRMIVRSRRDRETNAALVELLFALRRARWVARGVGG